MTQPESIAAPRGIHRLKRYYEHNERKVDIAAFAGGFVFDIVTLDRTDSWLVIGQQILYLAVITTVLLQMFFEEGQTPPDIDGMFALKRWFYQYRTTIVHFFLG